jgi:hypothetical protein
MSGNIEGPWLTYERLMETGTKYNALNIKQYTLFTLHLYRGAIK